MLALCLELVKKLWLYCCCGQDGYHYTGNGLHVYSLSGQMTNEWFYRWIRSGERKSQSGDISEDFDQKRHEGATESNSKNYMGVNHHD